MAETAELLVKISATTELLKQQLIQAENSVERTTKNIQRDLDKVDSKFGALNKSSGALATGFKLAAASAAGFIASIGVGTIIDATRKGLDYAASLGETAQQLGVTTKLMQEFRFAVTQNGGSTEEADNALAKFSVTIGKALNGNGAAIKSFASLGVSIAELQKASDSQRLGLVADAIASIPDPAQRAASAVALFGKGARAIIPTLEAGSKGFAEMGAEARKLGLVLSDEQIANADKTADKIDALSESLKVRFSGIVSENSKAIGEYAEALAHLLEEGFKFQKNFPGISKALQGFAAGGPVGAIYNYLSPDPAKASPLIPNTPRAIQPLNRFKPTPGRGPLKGGFGGVLGLGGVSAAGSFGALLAASGQAANDATSQFEAADRAAQSLRETLIDGETLDSRLKSFNRTLVADPTGPQDDGGLGQMLEQQSAKLDEYFQEYEQRGQRAQEFIAFQFENLFRGGIGDVWDNFQRIGEQVVAQVAAKFLIAMLSKDGLSGAGGIGGILSSAFSSVLGFANGGMPPVGKLSMVGERGPELFIPRVPGTIVSNESLRGWAAGSPVSIVINAPGATAETNIMIRRTLAEFAPNIVAAAKSETLRSARRGRL